MNLRQGQALFYIVALLASLFLGLPAIPPVAALTAPTVVDGPDFTSAGTKSLADRGGFVHNDGTFIYVVESTGTALQLQQYKIADNTLLTRTIPYNRIDVMGNPSAIVTSSFKNDTIIYQNQGGSTQALLTGSTTFMTEKVGSSSELIGKTINTVHVWLKKTGAPTGTATIAVFDSAGTTLYQFGTQDVSLLATSYELKAYRGATTGRTLASGDYIGVFFNAGSAGNTPDVEYVAANRFDGATATLSIGATGTGAQGAATFTDQTARDLKMVLSFEYVGALADDDNNSSFWENSGYVVRANHTNSDANLSIAPGHVDIPSVVAEKKTTASLFNGVEVDEIEVRLFKTGTPTGTATIAEFNNDGSVTNRVNQNTGTSVGCLITTARTACAELITASGALVGQTTNSATFGLLKTTSPTGDFSACVLNSSGNCVYTFGTMPANSLATTYALYTFTNFASTHTIASGDRIGIKALTVPTGGTYTMGSATADVYDGANSLGSQFGPTRMAQTAGTNTNIVLANGIVITAEHINSGSALVGKTVDRLTVGLLRTGVPEPADSVAACIFNATGDCTYTFGTIAANTLTTSFTQQTFTNGAATHTIASGDFIGVRYFSGSTSNSVTVSAATTDQWDSTATARANFDTANRVNQNLGTASACNVSTTTTEACAEKITAAGALVGQIVDTITLPLIKAGSPTGTITACVMDNTLACLYTFGSISASTVTTGQLSYTFHNTAATYTIPSSVVYIGVKGPIQGASNTIQTTVTTTDVYDTTNSIVSQWVSGAWSDTSTIDLGSSTSARNWRLDCHSCGTWAADAASDIGSSSANAGFHLECVTSCNAWSNYSTTNGLVYDVGSSTANTNFILDLVVNPTIRNTFGTIDVSTLPTASAVFTFSVGTDFSLNNAATTYVGVIYTGGSFNNYINLDVSSVDSYDSTNSVASTFGSNGAAWTDNNSNDVRFRLVDRAQTNADREAGIFAYADWGSAIKTGGIRLNFPDVNKIPSKIDIQSSVDASAWTDRRVDVTIPQVTGNVLIELQNTPGISERYWRVLVDTWGTANSTAIAEFDLVNAYGLGEGQVAHTANNDDTFFANVCLSAAFCGSAATAIIVKVDLSSVFDSSLSYTVAEGLIVVTTNFRLATVDGPTNNGIYWLEVECTCTTTNYRLSKFDYALGGSSLVQSGTDANNDANTERQSRIVAFNSGGADTIYSFVRQGTDGTSSKVVIFGSINGFATPVGTFSLATDSELAIAQTTTKIYAYAIENNSPFNNKEIIRLDKVTDTLDTADSTNYLSIPNGGGGLATAGGFSYSTDRNKWYLSTAQEVHAYQPSTGHELSGDFVGVTVDAGTGDLTNMGGVRFYYAGNGIWIEAASFSGTSWSFKRVNGINITPTIYTENLAVPLVINPQAPLLFNNKILFAACATNLHRLPSLNVTVGSDSDCTQYILEDIQANAIGRELPYQRSRDLVWAADYTNYNIHITVTSGTPPTDYSAVIKYGGKEIDRNPFDAAANAQVRLLYGQCYTLEFVKILTGIVEQATSICADDVLFKEAVLSTGLGFTFWTAPWGIVHLWNDTSNILTTTVRHTPFPYNYTVQIYNSTNHLIVNDNQTSPTEIESNNYNLTGFPNDGEVGADNPFKVVILDENGLSRYEVWFDLAGDYFKTLREYFGDINFNGWGILLFLPLIFAAMFTRNNAGIGGALVAVFIGFLVFFGFLSAAVFTPIILGLLMFIAIVGLLAYRQFTQ